MGGIRPGVPGHLEGLWGGGGGTGHEAKVTTPSRELWGHALRKMFEFLVSETAFPGEIPTYTTH